MTDFFMRMTQKKFYVELGAGRGLLSPLLYIPNREGKSFLDIGCGIGFALDFWQNVMKYGPALGLEAGDYGSAGKQCFQVDIRDEYLDATSRERLGTFDLVYACEVIEHVENPQTFLKDAASMLSPDGILYLTTPAPQAIRPENDEELSILFLSPTQHRFLLSPKVLAFLLKSLGLKYVYVIVPGNVRILIAASPKPINLDIDAKDTLVEQYMEHLSLSQNLEIRGGALYRRLKSLEYNKQVAQSLPILKSLRDCVQQAYGFDIYNPDKFLQEHLSLNAAEFYDHIPAYLCPLFVLMAIISAHEENIKESLAFLDRADLVQHKCKIESFDTLHYESNVQLIRKMLNDILP